MPSDGATFSLKWLLGPVTPADFFARNYEAEPLAVKRDDLHYYADLPGLDAIDELLVATVSDRREPGRGGNQSRPLLICGVSVLASGL